MPVHAAVVESDFADNLSRQLGEPVQHPRIAALIVDLLDPPHHLLPQPLDPLLTDPRHPLDFFHELRAGLHELIAPMLVEYFLEGDAQAFLH
jgi:hypothetical protein